MRRVASILVAVLVGFILGAVAFGMEMIPGFCTGNSYLQFGEKFQFGYISGVTDTCSVIANNDKSKTAVEYKRCMKDMVPNQIHAIVQKYLADHREHRHYQMADIVTQAVIKSSILVR